MIGTALTMHLFCHSALPVYAVAIAVRNPCGGVEPRRSLYVIAAMHSRSAGTGEGEVFTQSIQRTKMRDQSEAGEEAKRQRLCGDAAGAVLLILGGTTFQVPAILQAMKSGCRVITCDYLPDNPGHRLAHHYVNVNTTDPQAVLAVAREFNVDGILAYASDPAALTAATVAAQLGLPGSSAHAVEILTDKVLFRTFLQRHGFRSPRFAAASSVAESQAAAAGMGLPVMIKPVDSSGSKGVTRVTSPDDVAAAAVHALRYSRSSRLIVEEWIERDGVQIAGDGLVADGQLVFGGFGDEHFDSQCSPCAPVGESFPGLLSDSLRAHLHKELQRLFELLGIRDLVFNLDAMIDRDGRLLVIEIGPRAGGNALPQLIELATGVDLTAIAIRQALGLAIPSSSYARRTSRYVASHMLHSRLAGSFGGFRMAPSLHAYVTQISLIARLGDTVSRFASAKDTLGYALFEFPDERTMRELLPTMSNDFVPVVA